MSALPLEHPGAPVDRRRNPDGPARRQVDYADRADHMAVMPDIPMAAPCNRPDADPEDWHDPLRERDNRWTGTNHAKYQRMEAAAHRLCAGCPILNDCLNWALAHPHQTGVLGGLTHRRRLFILKNQPTPSR